MVERALRRALIRARRSALINARDHALISVRRSARSTFCRSRSPIADASVARPLGRAPIGGCWLVNEVAGPSRVQAL
jgi:uncharacterized heparinase superfamily protein